MTAGLPPAWPRSLLPRIRKASADTTLVVFDDDPTGTQTVRGVDVLIDPSTADLASALGARPTVVFVLTNSRSLPREAAVGLATRLGKRLRVAARRSGRRISIVSRSDSTLRGHFPAEVDALAAACGLGDAPVLVMPYLGEAGRVTIDDVHYVVRDGVATPVADTEFARDPAFGFRESDLRAWVAARLAADPARATATASRAAKDSRGDGARSRPITGISIEWIRSGGPDAVAQALRDAPARAFVVANAADDRDAEVIAAAMAVVEDDRALLARTAAGYVRARAGQGLQPLLGRHELRHPDGPGLVVVGSHVPTTTRQLGALLADPPAGVALELVEVPVGRLADPGTRRGILRRTTATASEALDRGIVPVVATSRELVAPEPGDPTGLALARRVSALLAGVVRALEARPRPPAWIIAKGGITSSDVAAIGLGARRATVVGPLLPGVPVWRVARVGGEAVLLVVFPGNVGDDLGLRSAVELLARAGAPPRRVSRDGG